MFSVVSDISIDESVNVGEELSIVVSTVSVEDSVEDSVISVEDSEVDAVSDNEDDSEDSDDSEESNDDGEDDNDTEMEGDVESVDDSLVLSLSIVLMLSLVCEEICIVLTDSDDTDSVDNPVLSSVIISVDFLTSVDSEKPLPSSVVKTEKLDDDNVSADPDPSFNVVASSRETNNIGALSSLECIED